MPEIHSSITLEKIEAAVERQMFDLDNPGFCLGCGAEVDGVEPDARDYRCEICGEHKVYGAEEVLLMLAL